MAYAGGAASPRDRAKALIGVAAVHVALALALLSGLTVTMARRMADSLVTFDVREVPPPPPLKPPQPKPKPQPMKNPAGAPAPRAEATPVAAPPAKLPIPSPIPAAKVAGTGSAASSGAALAGNGTGSGGTGSGIGGGGHGGFTPARLVSNIPNFEYARLASTGIPSGLVGVGILVGPNGAVSSCRIARSSGDPSIDALVCQLTERYVRFDPARDPYGRPIAQDITYFPNWRRR